MCKKSGEKDYEGQKLIQKKERIRQKGKDHKKKERKRERQRMR